MIYASNDQPAGQLHRIVAITMQLVLSVAEDICRTEFDLPFLDLQVH